MRPSVALAVMLFTKTWVPLQCKATPLTDLHRLAFVSVEMTPFFALAPLVMAYGANSICLFTRPLANVTLSSVHWRLSSLFHSLCLLACNELTPAAGTPWQGGLLLLFLIPRSFSAHTFLPFALRSANYLKKKLSLACLFAGLVSFGS